MKFFYTGPVGFDYGVNPPKRRNLPTTATFLLTPLTLIFYTEGVGEHSGGGNLPA